MECHFLGVESILNLWNLLNKSDFHGSALFLIQDSFLTIQVFEQLLNGESNKCFSDKNADENIFFPKKHLEAN
jgi:hypothetical protein